MNGYRKSDLRALAEGKLRDARILLDAQSWANAYYLAGYSVEIALKACIAVQIRAESIPDRRLIEEAYRHDLAGLVRTAGLARELRDKQDSNADFAANWAVTLRWTVDSRYEATDAFTAQALIDAIAKTPHGVLPWIRMYW